MRESSRQQGRYITLKALADNANDVRVTESNSQISDSVQGYSHGLSEIGKLE